MIEEYPGKFIVLEGTDGSGKGTQFKLLTERLKAVGYDVEVFDFPRYDQPSSHFVRRYLNGDYGPAAQINPYAASLFYALDRYEAGPEIRKALAAGKVVLSNRYTGSNMGHQGSKFNNDAEQRGFFVWADSLEFSLLGIPRPNLNLILRVPAETAYKLIAQKTKRSYTDDARDQHESDINHLKQSVATYDLLCQLFPKDFISIECTKQGHLMSITAINDLIWQVVLPLLPTTPPHKGRKVTVMLNAPVTKPVQTEATEPKLPTKTLAIELSGLSLLAASTIQTEPGISLELSQPWRTNNKLSPFYLPPAVNDELAKSYSLGMKKLAKLHHDLQTGLRVYLHQQTISKSELSTDNLAYEATRGVIPMAATVTAKLSAEATNISQLANRLATDPNKEFKSVAKRLSQFLKSQDILTTTSKSSDITDLLKQNKLSDHISSADETVKLLDYWPRSELSLLADGIYPYTDLSRDEIAEGLERWSYERKESSLRAMVLDATSRILERVNYRWDILSDRLTLADAVQAGLVDSPQLQNATPRYGYDVPELIEQAGLENAFMESFDTSLQLFSDLQSADREAQAAYVTLQGHKLRWQFSLDAVILASHLKPKTKNQSYKVFLDALMEKIMEVHPILASNLIRQETTKIRTAAQDSSTEPTGQKKRSHRRSRRARH